MLEENTFTKIKYITGFDESVLERVYGQGRKVPRLRCIEGNCRSVNYYLVQFPYLVSQEDNNSRLPIHLLDDAMGKEHILERQEILRQSGSSSWRIHKLPAVDTL